MCRRAAFITGLIVSDVTSVIMFRTATVLRSRIELIKPIAISGCEWPENVIPHLIHF